MKRDFRASELARRGFTVSVIPMNDLRTSSFLYGAFLIAMGGIAFAASGWDPKAKTAIMSGTMSGMMVLAAAWLAGSPRNCLSIAGKAGCVLLPLAFAGVFTWRASIALTEWNTPDWKTYKPVVIGTMQCVSLLIAGWNVHALFNAKSNRSAKNH